MESEIEQKGGPKAAYLAAGLLAGAGMLTLAALWARHRAESGALGGSLDSILNKCDSAAARLEKRLLLSA
jgi:hypothetical protein